MNKDNVKHYVLIAVLVILMHVDYVLTYEGVCNLGVIYEANPMMRWLFECESISYELGLLIRFLMTTPLIITLVYFEKKNYHKELMIALGFGISVNLFIMGCHARWMFFC